MSKRTLKHRFIDFLVFNEWIWYRTPRWLKIWAFMNDV